MIGDGVGGAARWISVGPFTFQFSELAKILMIIVLANYLGARQGRLDSIGSILGACVLIVPPLVLVMLQPDLGTSLVFGGILVGMLWMSGASLKWLLALGALVIAMIPLAWTYVLRDYQKARLDSFLNPAPDVQGAGYQLYQAQISVGSGGWLGKGLTNGTQTQGDFLPVQATDFVFAAYSEEHGLAGGVTLMAGFLALIFRGLFIASQAPTLFSRLLAGSVSLSFFTYAFVNMGMVSGILPVVGVPLPFISYGGTAMVTLGLGLGMLMSIAKSRGLMQR